MVFDQFVKDEYPNQRESVWLGHFYQIQLLLLRYVLQAIQQHNNDVV